jgi:hypothetical protein
MWWFLAIAMPTMQAVPCSDCPPPDVDPWAYAYSAPETTLLFLIAPSIIIALVALVRVRAAKLATEAGYISPS